ncbi:MAG: DNA/RNA nuclease SfsA [Desulfobulbaceae bacterium]
MQIEGPVQHGSLINRYKRFLADVHLKDGTVLTVHCPNSGSMLGCSTPGSEVVISRSSNPKRKYAWTLEMVRENGCWIGVNTARTNRLVEEGLTKGIIDDFGTIDSIQREVRVSEKSRLDFLLRSGAGETYIEVKNCSLAENNVALFPDAVTARGTKHLLELARLREEGIATAVLFCVQRGDAGSFKPAAAIDPVYAQTLAKVKEAGVMVLAYRAEVTPGRVTVREKLPVAM